MTQPSGVVRRSPPTSARVIAATQLTPRMRRVTVAADELRGVLVRPAQDVELWLTGADGRRVKRRYTIRGARPGDGELDLDVLLHGAGPGAMWGAQARPGDTVRFQGPRGKLELLPAAWHLFVGDESALPAIAAIAQALPTGERALAVIETAGPDDELPVVADVTWVHRAATPPGGAQLLRAALERRFAAETQPAGGRAAGPPPGPAAETQPAGGRAAGPPPGRGRGYLLGETRAMVALRPLLATLGIAAEDTFVKGYWNLGRPDRLAGRAPGASGSEVPGRPAGGVGRIGI